MHIVILIQFDELCSPTYSNVLQTIYTVHCFVIVEVRNGPFKWVRLGVLVFYLGGGLVSVPLGHENEEVLTSVSD